MSRAKFSVDFKRGDVYYADISDTDVCGSEQMGNRPVVIIQNDRGNFFSPTVIVAIITSRTKKELPTHVVLCAETLTVQGTVCLEQIRTLDKSRLSRYCGNVGKNNLDMIDEALGASVGIAADLIDRRSAESEQGVNMTAKPTVFDNAEIDWISAARQQMVFFNEIRQYMINLRLKQQKLADDIEKLLSSIEGTNYNVVQGYRAYRLICDKRTKYGIVSKELEQLEALTINFDCEMMRRKYQSAVSRMELIAKDEKPLSNFAEISEMLR